MLFKEMWRTRHKIVVGRYSRISALDAGRVAEGGESEEKREPGF